MNRSFFAFHALDYISHARQSLPTALCAVFPDTALPCPAHIWEAPTAEEWAERYRAWEEYCSSRGGVLRGRDVLSWVHGKETGREEQLGMWFREVDWESAVLVFECARGQGRVVGVEGLL
jgi:hypothetical protein